MKNIFIDTLQTLIILIAIPLIFLMIFKFGTPWVSTGYETVISDFSRDSGQVAEYIEKTIGFDLTNNQKIISSNKLDSIDALKNSFSLFMHSLFCISFLIILGVWIPIIGLLKGFYLGSFEIIKLYLTSFMLGAIIILTGFGFFYILYIWIGTLISETYTPGFFLVWFIIGLLSIFLGFSLGSVPYIFALLNVRMVPWLISSSFIIGGIAISILCASYEIVRNIFF